MKESNYFLQKQSKRSSENLSFTSMGKNDPKRFRLIQRLAQPFINRPKPARNSRICTAINKTNLSRIQQQKINKLCIQKYVYNFCFQIGCDLPSNDELKTIFYILNAFTKLQSNQEQVIDWNELSQNRDQFGKDRFFKKAQFQFSIQSFYLLIEKCFQLYQTSKTDNIGGIIDRLIISLKKTLQQNQNYPQNQKNQNQSNDAQKDQSTHQQQIQNSKLQ